MPPEAVKAQRAIQKLAEQAIRLDVFDEIAAITRTRPLEQVADWSGYGWGGTCYQLGPDRRLLQVVGMFSGLVTLAQASYHPRRGECLAQREVRRACRKNLGSILANCWTDHAHLAWTPRFRSAIIL